MSRRNAQELQSRVQKDYWFQAALDRIRTPREETNYQPPEEQLAPVKQSPTAPPLPTRSKPIQISIDS